ncbi:MAG: DUF4288 domain-containing protein [Bradymonadia bacterium]
MNWFSAKLLFAAFIDGRLNSDALVEESIIIFRATTAAAASIQADELGQKATHSYKNEVNEEVEWRYIRLLEIQDLGETTLDDGVEVFSTMRRRSPEDEL